MQCHFCIRIMPCIYFIFSCSFLKAFIWTTHFVHRNIYACENEAINRASRESNYLESSSLFCNFSDDDVCFQIFFLPVAPRPEYDIHNMFGYYKHYKHITSRDNPQDVCHKSSNVKHSLVPLLRLKVGGDPKICCHLNIEQEQRKTV